MQHLDGVSDGVRRGSSAEGYGGRGEEAGHAVSPCAAGVRVLRRVSPIRKPTPPKYLLAHFFF